MRYTPRKATKYATLEERQTGKHVLRKKQCAKCGEFFLMRYDRKYCSKKCHNDSMRGNVSKRERNRANTRARKLNKLKTWDEVPDAAIFARDSGVCQLGPQCKFPGVPIDPEAHHPLPLSPSIDHIIPLSHYGIDVEANKRATHLACNCSRNNRLTDEDRAFMEAHPELILAPEQLAALPSRKKREPKPKRVVLVYDLPCSWCGVRVSRFRQASYVACGNCPGSSAGCCSCGAKMVIVAGSRPPETRKCRSCAKADPSPNTVKPLKTVWETCTTCGGLLYSNNKVGVCQRTPTCRRAYARESYARGLR